MPGTGCCAVSDSIRLTARAVQHGAAGCLMLPPFYYKAVGDEGLYRSFARIIDAVGDARLRIYLYHIPPVAQVGISFELIERLLQGLPRDHCRHQDSSGDWNHTQELVTRFARSGFDCSRQRIVCWPTSVPGRRLHQRDCERQSGADPPTRGAMAIRGSR